MTLVWLFLEMGGKQWTSGKTMECNVYAERGRPQRSRAPGSEAPTAAAGNKAAEKKPIMRRQ